MIVEDVANQSPENWALKSPLTTPSHATYLGTLGMGKHSHDASLGNLLRGNTATIVLSVLRDGPAHGYAIANEILTRTQHAIEFKQGTLYPLLHELERDGHISSDWEILPGERPRRVYTLTESGQTELERRMKTLREFSTAMFRLTGVKADEPSR